MARPDLHDRAFKAGAQVSVARAGLFDLSAQLALEAASTENSIYSGTALRTDVVVLAGFYGRRWFAAGEAGYGRAWLTHIDNSAWYRNNFYAGAVDGWYRGTGGTLSAGGKAGVTLGAIELVLRAGVNTTEALQALDLPFYATLGASYRF
jgi:hypothetical protein